MTCNKSSVIYLHMKFITFIIIINFINFIGYYTLTGPPHI